MTHLEICQKCVLYQDLPDGFCYHQEKLMYLVAVDYVGGKMWWQQSVMCKIGNKVVCPYSLEHTLLEQGFSEERLSKQDQ